MFRTGHGRNDYAYSNSTFDALLDEVGTERVRARRERLMFEAERTLLSDFVIIPIYSYVTKRLVDQHLRGWQNNVMDHHLTRHMFQLKSRVEGAEMPENQGASVADPELASPREPESEPQPEPEQSVDDVPSTGMSDQEVAPGESTAEEKQAEMEATAENKDEQEDEGP